MIYDEVKIEKKTDMFLEILTPLIILMIEIKTDNAESYARIHSIEFKNYPPPLRQHLRK